MYISGLTGEMAQRIFCLTSTLAPQKGASFNSKCTFLALLVNFHFVAQSVYFGPYDDLPPRTLSLMFTVDAQKVFV